MRDHRAQPTPEPCSLSAPALGERIARIERELLPFVDSRKKTTEGAAWRFVGHPGLRARVEAWIAEERVCCSGLDFALVPPEGGGPFTLHVAGPGAEIFLQGAEPGRSRPTAASRRGR